MEALQIRNISEPSEFERAVSKVFEDMDSNKDGCIDRKELEHVMRTRIYKSCPPKVWAVSPDELLQKLGGTDQRVTRAEFANAVERMADTLDRRVWPLATSQFFSAFMFALNQPLMPLLVKELGISMAQFGGMVAVLPLMRVFMAFPATYVSNTFGRKPLTVEGQLVAAAGFVLSSLVSGPWQLIASRIVIGVGTSSAGVGQNNMLGDIATGRTRSRIFAPSQMRAGAAFTVGPAIGGWLAATMGVQVTYVAIGVGMAAVSFRNRHILTETLQKPRHVQTKFATPGVLSQWWCGFRRLAADPALRAVTLANTGYNFTAISSKFVLLPMLALDTWGLTPTELGLAMGGMSLAQLLAARPAAHVADVYGRKVALLPGLALSTGAMGLASTGLGSPEMIALVCCAWAAGASLVGSVPSALALDAAARLGMDQQETARALAISRVAGDAGMIAGSLVSGALLSSLSAPEAFSLQALSLGAITAAAAVALRRM